jgi:hypothetical protein
MGVKLGNGKWAIKEDKLLAYNDNSGRFFNKEFDFSRGSSATYVAKDGLIKVSGVTDTELVTNGDFATDSDWQTQTGWSISNGKANAISAPHLSRLTQVDLGQNINRPYKITFTVSNLTEGNFKVWFGTAQSDDISNDGDYVIYLTPTTTQQFFIYANGTTTGSIDNVSVVEIQTDVPRIDFTDTSKGALLLEPQSTNVLEDSEITSTWTYTEFGSGSSGTITTGKTDMFGGTNAIQIDFPADAENVTLRFGQLTSSISSGSASGSVYIKLVESGSKTLQLRCSPGLRTLVNVDATNFVRYQLSGTKTNNEAFTLKLRPSEGTSSGGFSIIVCQPQEEALSYATSYIPTYGSVATRNADLCNNSGSAQDFNSEEGVLYAEIAALADDLTFRGLSISDGTDGNRVLLRYRTTSNQINLFIKADGVLIVNSTKALTDITNYSKIAIKYKSGDIALWVDGQEAKTHTNTFTLIGLDRLNFDAGNGSDDFYGKVRNVQVFTEALTDEQLQKLTT